MAHDKVTDLLPGYVLGALDEEEQRLVEQALVADPAARALLAEYEASAAALLALAPLRAAPEHLQADLRARLAAQQAVTRPQAMVRRRRPWPLLAAAAALVVILAAAVIALLLRGDDESPAEDRSRALYTELAGRESAQWYTVVPGEVDPDVSGELVVSPEGDRAVIRVEELPPLTDENVFQLWLVDSEGDRSSGGLFRQADDDATYIEIPLAAPVASYQGFGVSLEPAGGSPYPDRPTGPRVFSVPLDA